MVLFLSVRFDELRKSRASSILTRRCGAGPRFSKVPISFRIRISSLTITELFYSHILNMNRGSLHTRSFSCNAVFTAQFEIQMNKKSFRGFRETGHWPVEFYIFFFLLITCYIFYFILYSINLFNFVPCKARLIIFMENALYKFRYYFCWIHSNPVIGIPDNLDDSIG